VQQIFHYTGMTSASNVTTNESRSLINNFRQIIIIICVKVQSSLYDALLTICPCWL